MLSTFKPGNIFPSSSSLGSLSYIEEGEKLKGPIRERLSPLSDFNVCFQFSKYATKIVALLVSFPDSSLGTDLEFTTWFVFKESIRPPLVITFKVAL